MTEQDPLLIRLDAIRADLVAQGRRVQTLVDRAFDAVFTADVALAEQVIASDDDVDDVDVQIERASVSLLQDSTEHTAALTERQLRSVLTIVKVNNELERIADAGVSIAQRADDVHRASTPLPETLRVMCN
ncbi:MAG: PhoU domain-containing protein, partial [Phycisphaerales bacterium]|nr:PhoU domain-containing protein [Phycisphaerales bacterium]